MFLCLTRSAARPGDRLAYRAAPATTLPQRQSTQCCPTRSELPTDLEVALRTQHWRSLVPLPKQGPHPRPNPTSAATLSCPAQDEVPEPDARPEPCGRRSHACAEKPHKPRARERPSRQEQ